MANIAESYLWQGPQRGRFDLAQPKPLPWWRRPSVRQALPHVVVFVAVLVACSVLLAFYQVVSNAVHHGELLRQAMAEQARATWQCSTLPDNGASESCLRLLKAATPTTSVALNP